MNFSPSEENYLKAIFHLQLDVDTVTTTALAHQLEAKPASITDMMKKLSSKGVLHYKPYYGFSLSAEGKKIALGIIRRHRLWEYFLSEKLGFNWKEVHAVAEEMEHVRSKKLIDKLDEFLGFPQFDPHGDPIPDSKGRVKMRTKISLAHLPLHQSATVIRVSNQSEEMLELLQHKHIAIGSVLEVQKLFAFDQSLQLKIRPQRIETISEQLAKNIFVAYETGK